MRVLSFGYVEELLRERHRLLTAAGFQVTSVDTKSNVLKLLENEEFNVLIVGHGVPVEQRNEVAVRAKIWRRAGVIFLYRWNINRAEFADAVLSVDCCPENLAEAVLTLAAEPGKSDPSRRRRRFFNPGN
ncbi:MAG TPA: hypothetical protein VGH51_17165 [Candidatus Angelobacter sp.]